MAKKKDTPLGPGVVVEHKENGIRYARSHSNFNPKVHKKIRDLGPDETVWGYLPRYKEQVAMATPPTPEETSGTNHGKDN